MNTAFASLLPSLSQALELALHLGGDAAPRSRGLRAGPRSVELRLAVAAGVASMRRLVTQVSRQPALDGGTDAADLADAYRMLGSALRALAVADRDAVELHHAAPVRLPPGLEGRAQVGALALLEVARRVRDVRPVMGRRLSRALRGLVMPAEELLAAERIDLVPLDPLAEALMVAYGEVAGAMICRLALGQLP